MDQLLNRLLGNPIVMLVAGGVFGFWLIGETSRHVKTPHDKQEIAQTVALQELLKLMRQQRDELEVLRRQYEGVMLPGPSEAPEVRPEEVKGDADLDGSARGDRGEG